MKALNITVPFEHNSHHYAGVVAHNGVTFELIDAPCGQARQLVFFGMALQRRMLIAKLARITYNYFLASEKI